MLTENKNQDIIDANIKENGLTRYGVRRPHFVFVMIAIISILGIFSFTTFAMDLFPNMNIPFLVVQSNVDQANHDGFVENPLWTPGSDMPQFLPSFMQTLPNGLPNPVFNPDAPEPNADVTMELTTMMETRLLMVNGVYEITSVTTDMSAVIMIELSGSASVDAVILDIVVTMSQISHQFYGRGFTSPSPMRLDPSMMPVLNFNTSFTRDVFNPDGTINQVATAEATYEWYREVFIPTLTRTPGVANVGANLGILGGGNNFSFFNGDASFGFSVQQTSEAMTTTTIRNVLATLEQLEQDYGFPFPNITNNQGEFIEASVGNVFYNLILGMILAVAVLFLFLRNIKLTLAIAIAIPLSIIATFVLMYFMGIGLNIVSMSGLALAVGMLIDNGIIVVENIYRLRKKGFSIRDSAIKGASQIFVAIVAATLTTVAVFLPMFFVSGLMMEVFMDMVWVIVFSLLASLVVAVMFLPSIIASFKICVVSEKKSQFEILPDCKTGENCDPGCAPVEPQQNWIQRGWGKWLGIWAKFNAWMAMVFAPVSRFWAKCKTKMDKWYNSALRFTLRFKWLTLGTVLLMFVGSVGLIMLNGFELMPAQDTGSFSASITISSNYGGSDDLARRRATALTLTTGDDNLFDVISDTLNLEDANIAIAFSAQPGMMAMMQGNFGSSLNINIALPSSRPHSTAYYSDRVFDALMYFFEGQIVDPENPATDNLFVGDISMGGGGAGMAAMVAGEVIVTIQSVNDWRLGPAVAMLRYYLGQLDGVTRVSDNFNPNAIVQVNRNLTAQVTAYVDATVTISHVQSLVNAEVARLFNQYGASPSDVFYNVNTVADGFERQMADTIPQMAAAIVIGLVLMYLVMVGIFRSFKSPFIMLITIPLGFMGAFLLLFVLGMPLSIVAMIGLLILMGIIVNNGIVMVDYINQARDEGLSVREAIIAAANTRVRPILITSISTILAKVPMAIGTGTGAELMQPMAIAIIGGAITATFMSLLVVPAFYAIFNRDKKSKTLTIPGDVNDVTSTL